MNEICFDAEGDKKAVQKIDEIVDCNVHSLTVTINALTPDAGAEVYEKMWQPMLIGKFGPFYKDVNMAWMWARACWMGIRMRICPTTR